MALRVPNPYRPGFNQAPMVLAGRSRVLAAIDEALAVAALDGRTPRPIVLTGSRGVGKTVILGEAGSRAADSYSWLTAPVEIRPDTPFVPQLIERLAAVRDLYRQTKAGSKVSVVGATVKASVLGVGAELELAKSPRQSSAPLSLDQALAEVIEAGAEHSAGLLITIDELQLAARPELGDFAATLQQRVPSGWPLVIVMAGLPNIRGTHKGITYLERAEWHLVKLLDETDSVEALREPAAEAGRPMSPAAAEELAAASGGYPYAIQLMGHHAWRASTGSATIEATHVGPAVRDAQEELTAGLYSARWEDSTDREREYLSELAGLSASEERVTGGMVAQKLGKPAKAVSYLRDRLIQKGTIFAEGETLRFSIPGMAEWVRATSPNAAAADPGRPPITPQEGAAETRDQVGRAGSDTPPRRPR